MPESSAQAIENPTPSLAMSKPPEGYITSVGIPAEPAPLASTPDASAMIAKPETTQEPAIIEPAVASAETSTSNTSSDAQLMENAAKSAEIALAEPEHPADDEHKEQDNGAWTITKEMSDASLEQSKPEITQPSEMPKAEIPKLIDEELTQIEPVPLKIPTDPVLDSALIEEIAKNEKPAAEIEGVKPYRETTTLPATDLGIKSVDQSPFEKPAAPSIVETPSQISTIEEYHQSLDDEEAKINSTIIQLEEKRTQLQKLREAPENLVISIIEHTKQQAKKAA